MKISFRTLSFVLIPFSSLFCFSQNPVSQVQPFIPDILKAFPNVRDLALSTEGNEMCFSIQSPLSELSGIVYLKKENTNWSKPQVLPFSGQFNDLEPFFAPDGLRLYFVSNRPTDPSSKEAKDFDIWYVERKSLNDKWSEAKNMGTSVNTKNNEFYPSITRSGNLYFTCDAGNTKGKDDIFVSTFRDGKYEAAQSLSDSINSAGYEFNAFVDPNEFFIVYTCYNREGGLGSGDLYISYNKGNGVWSKAKNLGSEFNSAQMDYCPFVDLKTSTLYFTSKRTSVKTQFDKNQNIDELTKEINKHDNGLSRLYQASFKMFLPLSKK